ncbi:(d)CMP kinase [Paenibacillus sp. N1-5-1-14]|uniref:(d)CMP kinase n=1 Tax=Paenibacillus radicibacter TaxID=2972488 RepID=UPI0021592958|nr:(d)CMP kinase [Paenibacillus radicibacter]MCR8642317.1 (d)CMP kinase [Paenibacillus radicibacter]
MRRFNIAIDGPAGAGKSTIARLVANQLGFIYVDTGAMYRAVTWKVLQEGLLIEQIKEITEVAQGMDISLMPGANGQLVFVDGQDVTSDIRSSEVTNFVSYIASIGEVRKLLVEKQKQMAAEKGIVMDGRDIGTHVLPDAEMKIFLTASVTKRAERRFAELQVERPELTLAELEQDIARRDHIDENREISPLVRAEDAILLDSTSMTIAQVVEQILDLCRSRVLGGIS